MTDYVHQVAFLRKPLQLAKTQLEDAYLNKRELSKECIHVLINGEKVPHALYQSPAKACFNTVFNCKMDRRHLLWGSPSECYNRMFAGEVSEGASPISHRKRLPCVNVFFSDAEERKWWRNGCRNGRYHPKYWGVDWGFRQWFDYEVNRKKEGKSIEDEVKAQMHAEGFQVLNDSSSALSSSVTASSSSPYVPQKSEAADVSTVKTQITPPEKYIANALAAARTLGARELEDHQARVRAKACGLARDNWLPVPLTHIPLDGRQQGNSQSTVPELVLTDPCGQPFELVERPDRPRRRETEMDAKARQHAQKRLYYAFERWDLYCKRREEYFEGRGDLNDATSEMMRRFQIEKANAENARSWWLREQKRRDKSWKPCPGAFAEQAMKTRYRQLFHRIFKRKRSAALREERMKSLEAKARIIMLFIRTLGGLLVRGMIVEGKDGLFRAGKGIILSDRLEMLLRRKRICVSMRNLASEGYEHFTAAGLRNSALKKRKETLAAGSKKKPHAKRLDKQK